MFANIDLYILAFSALTVFATIFMGFWTAKKSRTASDFFVAGRSVSVGWNASAISGEYLSAASFMGIAGMVMSSGYDALWYPVCYACGYLFLLLFIAGPLRRFGAYTIPDFAEGRFDSPVFRKIAVVFVLFIGFFYTMPQMKGAGVTLAYIFPGLPYWVGVVLVGAVITLNVALGGMKGITLVQAFQYWAKMFAISVPIFVLMAVYGHYGDQLKQNNRPLGKSLKIIPVRDMLPASQPSASAEKVPAVPELLRQYARKSGALLFLESSITNTWAANGQRIAPSDDASVATIESSLAQHGIRILRGQNEYIAVPGARFEELKTAYEMAGLAGLTKTEIPNRFKFRYTGPVSGSRGANSKASLGLWRTMKARVQAWFKPATIRLPQPLLDSGQIGGYALALYYATEKPVWFDPEVGTPSQTGIRSYDLNITLTNFTQRGVIQQLTDEFDKRHIALLRIDEGMFIVPSDKAPFYRSAYQREGMYPFTTNEVSGRLPLPAKAPADATWLNPFGPLTTKAAKTAAAAIGKKAAEEQGRKGAEGKRGEGDGAQSPSSPLPLSPSAIPLRAGLSPDQRMTVALDSPTVAQALGVYAELTGRQLLPNTNSLAERADDLLGGKLSALKLVNRPPVPDSGVREHGDGLSTAAEVKAAIEAQLATNGLALAAVGEKGFRVEQVGKWVSESVGKDTDGASPSHSPAHPLTHSPEQAWLAKHEKPLALLYTYSLIIAIVCGTAGLPHILVRFYTNPDGGAAKRTTMWVMILIGVFYVFPPVFGALGRNLMPDLYTGLAGIKGTDQVVLKLPVLLNEKYPPLGSILSGITCAGAFAAFMSTFSGLLVSMTGALAHDVYGRILRPKSTPEQRMRMFKIGAVLIGGVAVLLGSFVEPLEINFMVGQAFAIAAASYFPLLFMAVWWRKLTMKGAAVGMLAGGVCALAAATLTNFSNLALDKGPMGKLFAGFAPLNNYWADHPLLRILCEQPAIWAVPLALTLMVVVSKLTAKSIPEDIRMKMLVLHAPEELGLKQEYIQEHSAPPGH